MKAKSKPVARAKQAKTKSSKVSKIRKQDNERILYLAGLVNNMSDALISTDMEFNILEWNRAAENMYGWRAAEVTGHPLQDFIQSEYTGDTTREDAIKAVMAGKVWKGEMIQKRRDGTRFPVMASVSLVSDKTGKPIGLVAINREITERKRAEEKIERQNQRLLVLREIDLAILAADSVESIVGAALSHIRELIDCRRTNLTLIDRGTNELVIFEARTAGETSIPAGSRLPVALFEDIIQTLSQNQPILLSDLRTVVDPMPGIQRLLKDGLLSTCSLPLFSQGSLVGMFSMHSEIPGFFDEEKIALGREVANQVAIALTQNHLVEGLRESEEKYRAFFQNSLDAILLTSPDGSIQAANPAACKMFGRMEAEICALGTDGLIDTNDPKLVALLEELARTGKTFGELSMFGNDGSPFPVEISSAQFQDRQGNTRASMIVRDITERKRAEERLILSETRYRRLFESAKDGILILDAETGLIVDVNPFLITKLGYSKEAFVGKSLWELGFFKDMIANKLNFLELQQKEYIRYEDLPLETASGRRINVEFVSNVYEEDHQKVIQCNIRDITERRQAEAQIERQLQRLNALHAIDIAISSSFDLRVILDVVLQQVLAQLGVDAAAILLFNPEMQTLEFAASRGFRSAALNYTRLKPGEGYAGRVMLERKTMHVSNLLESGGKLARALHLENEFFVEYYGAPLIVKGEVEGVLEIYHRSPLRADPERQEFLETLAGQAAIAIDNAQLFDGLQRANAGLEGRVAKRTEELNRLNIELEHASRAKDEFLAGMSHELRTPLNSILGFSEMLLEQRRGPLNEKQEQAVHLIASSGQHLLSLINDILDVSKIEAGKLEIHPDRISIKEVCESSLNFIKEFALKKSINLEYQLEASLTTLEADPQRLKQILVNLLNNAVKFTPENGEVRLEVYANEAKDQIRFSVSDTGIGIAPNDLRKLFTPFTQLDSSLARQYEGTGLGLVLVYKFTELHGGSVQVESEVGKGSRFTVVLPWSQNITTGQNASEGIFKSAEASTNAPLPSGERGIILLAEDNASNILAVNEYLQDHGYTVVVAQNGLEALEKAEETGPGVILMDIQMPEMDGLEAIRRLRAIPRFSSTPIIALTALAMPGDREMCLEAGASEYISKPASLKKLVKTISKLLGNEE